LFITASKIKAPKGAFFILFKKLLRFQIKKDENDIPISLFNFK
jgi:hypothetical protein